MKLHIIISHLTFDRQLAQLDQYDTHALLDKLASTIYSVTLDNSNLSELRQKEAHYLSKLICYKALDVAKSPNMTQTFLSKQQSFSFQEALAFGDKHVRHLSTTIISLTISRAAIADLSTATVFRSASNNRSWGWR